MHAHLCGGMIMCVGPRGVRGMRLPWRQSSRWLWAAWTLQAKPNLDHLEDQDIFFTADTTSAPTIFSFMYTWAYAMCMWFPKRARRQPRPLGNGAIGDCEPPNVGALDELASVHNYWAGSAALTYRSLNILLGAEGRASIVNCFTKLQIRMQCF